MAISLMQISSVTPPLFLLVSLMNPYLFLLCPCLSHIEDTHFWVLLINVGPKTFGNLSDICQKSVRKLSVTKKLSGNYHTFQTVF